MNDIITTACKFVTSSIGRKIIVALTGSCLLLFLVGHLAGNMTIYGDALRRASPPGLTPTPRVCTPCPYGC